MVKPQNCSNQRINPVFLYLKEKEEQSRFVNERRMRVQRRLMIFALVVWVIFFISLATGE